MRPPAPRFRTIGAFPSVELEALGDPLLELLHLLRVRAVGHRVRIERHRHASGGQSRFDVGAAIRRDGLIDGAMADKEICRRLETILILPLQLSLESTASITTAESTLKPGSISADISQRLLLDAGFS